MTYPELDPNHTNPVDLADHRRQRVAPGCRVRLCGDHPHAGKLGTYAGVDVLATGEGAKIDLDEGGGCYVFKPTQWEALTPSPPARKRSRARMGKTSRVRGR